ncbi:hypothetical protein BC827DRAFT_799510 [Russula dissimulans]|nr:hypothetical protein BC827DRAFT_799510 [Russula dissimulans]
MSFTTTYHSGARSRAASVRRELGSHALGEYISTKAVHWNYGENIEWPFSAPAIADAKMKLRSEMTLTAFRFIAVQHNRVNILIGASKPRSL